MSKLFSTSLFGGVESDDNAKVGISRRDIENFRYSCLDNGDRAMLEELRAAPAYARLAAGGGARVPENTPIDGGRRRQPRRSRIDDRHARRRASRLQYQHQIPSDEEDDYDERYAEEGIEEYENGGCEREWSDRGVHTLNSPADTDLTRLGDLGMRKNRKGVVNRHHVTGETAVTRLSSIDSGRGQTKVDRLEVRQASSINNRKESNEFARRKSSSQVNHQMKLDSAVSSGSGEGSTRRKDVVNVVGVSAGDQGVRDEGTGRNASFADSTSRQHTRDGFYSRQNSRLTESRRAAAVEEMQPISQRQQRKQAATITSPGGDRRAGVVGGSNAVNQIRDSCGNNFSQGVPLADMSFWQRFELFKKAQRSAYADALGYAQLHKPRPSEYWMFGHRIHRAFVFSYFGAPEKPEQPADATGEQVVKKKKRKRKRGGGKVSEMKSIFGSVLPQDFYPGGKMNIDGKYTYDYNQISV